MYNDSLVEEKQEEVLRKNRNKIYQISGIPKNTLKIFRTIQSPRTFITNPSYSKNFLPISRIKENLF